MVSGDTVHSVTHSALFSLLTSGPVNLSHLSREARLLVINDFLSKQDLRPLEAILDAQEGQMEILGVNKFTPDKFVSRVDFLVTTGKYDEQGNLITFNHLTFINTHTAHLSGIVIVPVVYCAETQEEYILLIKTGRVTLGSSLFELPRGFSEPSDAKNNKSLSSAILAAHRELKEETGLHQLVQDSHYTFLRDTYENTGTHNVKNSNVALILSATANQLHCLRSTLLHHEEEIGMALTLTAVRTTEAFELIQDNHSITALSCWMHHKARSLN